MLLHRPIGNSDFNPQSAIRNPRSRQGLSLAEVLIALLILALGMMGILALFPLGAKQMADAIKDERTAQLAEMGEGLIVYRCTVT